MGQMMFHRTRHRRGSSQTNPHNPAVIQQRQGWSLEPEAISISDRCGFSAANHTGAPF